MLNETKKPVIAVSPRRTRYVGRSHKARTTAISGPIQYQNIGCFVPMDFAPKTDGLRAGRMLYGARSGSRIQLRAAFVSLLVAG